jgi:hypothetical protein
LIEADNPGWKDLYESIYLTWSFRDGPKDQTRNLEIPGSMLRIAPE